MLMMSSVATAQRAPAPVRVDAVRLEPVRERRMVTGEIRAVHRAKVASQEAGILEELLVTEGDRVSKGQPLARIDSSRLSISLTGRQADLRAARALATQRQADLRMIKRDVKSIERAVRNGAANQKELLDAQSDASGAEAALAEAQSRAASIEAAIELLQARLEDMTIRAPFEGVVVSRNVEVGEWLDGGDEVVEILSIDPLEAWLDVPQQLLGAALANNSKIEILDTRTGRLIASERGRVIPLVDERARTFSLVVTVANDAGDIAPGVAVSGSAPTGEVVDRLTIDRDAILRNESGPYVYVLRKGAPGGPDLAHIAAITPLFDFEGRLVIGFGALQAGDRIVVEGNERLRPAAPVVAIDPEADETADAGANEAMNRPGAGG